MRFRKDGGRRLAPWLIAALAVLAAVVLLGTCSACRAPGRLKTLKRTDLFELGYGLGSTQVDVAPPKPGAAPNSLNLAFRDGIAHISNSGAARVMRLSAYGDLLAMIFDPARSSAPLMNDSAFAVRIGGFSPGAIVVDSRQRIFIEDRMALRGRTYNAAQGAWCDRVVRRFGKGGAEEPWIGQEGPGGSPFPSILGIHIVENDELVVVSATETFLVTHRFASDGTFLFSLLLPRDSLPAPSQSGPGKDQTASVRLHAYPDGALPFGSQASPRLAVKLDYVRERYDTVSGAVTGVEPAGSWIMTYDMKTAALVSETRLSDPVPGREEPPLRLLGRRGGAYVLLESLPDAAVAANVRIVEEDGTVSARFGLEMPEGAAGMPDILLADGSTMAALLEMPLGMKVVSWSLGSVVSTGKGAKR